MSKGEFFKGEKMKLAKLSLVAMVVCGSSLFAAETLEEAFKASKVTGELKAEYASSNFLGQIHSDNISGVAGSLGIVTDPLFGFKVGATFQASHIIDTDRAGGVFSDDLDAAGAVLSEAYVEYTLSKTSLKVGRQFIFTPLVATSASGQPSESLIKDAFEAYMVTNTDLPKTTLMAGYISKYQNQTDGNGDIGKFEKLEDGAYTVYAKNQSIANLTLQAQYLDINGEIAGTDKNVFYAQVDYVLAGHTLSAQYINSTDKALGSTLKDGQAWGVKATGPLGLGQLGYVTAFTSSMEDGDVYAGLGRGTVDLLFTAMPVNNAGVAQRGNTDTIVGGIIVPIAGVTFIPYLGKSFCEPNAVNASSLMGDVTGSGLIAIYPVDKHFLIKGNYEHVTTEKTYAGIPTGFLADKETDAFKLYLSYKF